MNEERWHEIEGFSKYVVNPYTCEIMNKESKHILTPCDCGGYPRLSLIPDNGRRKSMFCHRLFMHLLSGKGNYVNHKDGNKENWHIDNLELVTHQENILHCTRVLGKKLKNNHLASKPLYMINTTTGEKTIIPSTNEAARYISENFNVKFKQAESKIYGLLKGLYLNTVYFGYTFERIHSEIDLSEFYPYPKNYDYMVSKDGRIYSTLTKSIVGGTENVYKTVKLSNKGKSKTTRIHIVVAETFLPNPDNLPLVDHINQDKLDNRVSNLRWVSHSDNAKNSSNATNPPNVGINSHKSKPYASFDGAGKLINIFESKTVICKCKLTYSSIKKAVKNNSLYRDLYWKQISTEEYLFYRNENPDYEFYKEYTKHYTKLYASNPVIIENSNEKIVFKTLKEAGKFLCVSSNSVRYNINNNKTFKGFSFLDMSKEEYIKYASNLL